MAFQHCESTHVCRLNAAAPGKYKRCEREAGHKGAHAALYAGRVVEWRDKRETKGGRA